MRLKARSGQTLATKGGQEVVESSYSGAEVSANKQEGRTGVDELRASARNIQIISYLDLTVLHLSLRLGQHMEM